MWRLATSASTGAKWLAPKERGAATRRRPRSSPVGIIVSRASSSSAVDVVEKTGRKQLIIAGLWTEVCVAMPAIQAIGDGWDTTVITDASGGTSVEAHKVAIQRMASAGVNMMTWMAVAAEWQRDWAQLETAVKLTEVSVQQGGGSGIAYLWEQRLRNTAVPKS